jgi:hypothetical protein
MTDTFREHRLDTLAQGGIMAQLRLWRDTILGVVTTAPREHLDVLRQDMRYALRSLRRSPGFAAASILALAVGIGANTAVFSIVNSVLFKALPYSRPEQLVTMFEKVPGAPVEKFGFSAPDFEIIRRHATSFTDLAAYRNVSYELSGAGSSDRVTVTRVSPEIFPLLGASAALGRTLTSEDDAANAAVAVLSFGLWNRAFGGDPAVVGKTIALDRRPYTIVGVMPQTFAFPPRGSTLNGEPAALFAPIAFSPFERQAFGMMYNNSVVGRLKPGVSIEAARSELGGLSKPLIVVLLIGCVDVANLILTRSGARYRELAIRSAIGASPTRVVRQLLTESLVLSLAGGGLGLALAYWAMRAFLSLAGSTLPRVESIALDWPVVAFTATLALTTPLLFGLAPALQTAIGSTLDALKEGSHSTAGPARHRLLRTLVVAQVALALVLSVGAGLFLRSFVRLLGTEPGFRIEHVVNASTTLPSGQYPTGQAVKAFYAQAVDAVRQIPGVTVVGGSSDRPLGIRERRAFTPDTSTRSLPTLNRVVAATSTVGQYFEALGIPLERGRFSTDADGRTAQRVVILNERLARAFWPGVDPIGHQIKWGVEGSVAPWMTIVGVVGDVKQGPLNEEIIPLIYVPLAQELPDEMRGPMVAFLSEVNVVARIAGGGDATVATIGAALRRSDPALPPAKTEAIAGIVSDSVQPQRFSMTVVSSLAVVALVLAVVGIYGVLANAVVQQRREIGVRIALGATPRDLLWLVLRRALIMMATGIAIGTVSALAITRVMAGLLYEIRPTDAVAFLGSVVLLAGLAVVASLVPAWRATRVDPLVALRAD